MSIAIPARMEFLRSGRLTQLAIAGAAILAMAASIALLVWLFIPSGAAPSPRNPFGMGTREAAPGGSALGRLILAYQASFNRALEAALSALKRDGGSPWPLVTLGFAYGVFHAAGPGHGKGIISAYLLANERALARGFAIGLAAALLQGTVAIALVAVLAIVLHATAPTVTRVSDFIEVSSFVLVTLLGLYLAWRKAGRLVGLLNAGGRPGSASCADEACGHVHMPSPDAVARMRSRDLVAVIVAAGARPCAGAILILVFALSQDLFAAGTAAVLAMSLGTASTTGAVAALAVFAKRIALRFAAGQGRGTAIAGAGFELAIAAFVAVLGVSLVLGLSAGIAAG